MYNAEHDCKPNDTCSIRSQDYDEVLRDDAYGSGDADGERIMMRHVDDIENNKDNDKDACRDDDNDDGDHKGNVDFHDVESADHLDYNDEQLCNKTSEHHLLHIIKADGIESKEEDSFEDFLHGYNNNDSSNYNIATTANDIVPSDTTINSHINYNVHGSIKDDGRVSNQQHKDDDDDDGSIIQVTRKGSRSNYLSCFSSVDGDHEDESKNNGQDVHDNVDRYHQSKPMPPLQSCIYQRLSNPKSKVTNKKKDVFGSSCVIT